MTYLTARAPQRGLESGHLGQQPASLPRVVDFSFRNQDGTTSDPANCCVSCQVTLANGRQSGTGINLGVGQGGTASNGMELMFVLSGHRPGLEYDITRTRRNSLWERRNGVWACLEARPMGTKDDRHDADECLRPTNNRLFVIDRPGWAGVTLPAPAGTIFRGESSVAHPDATNLVLRASFAEWVIARSRSEGIPWTPLQLPTRRDGNPRRFVFWHTITWLTRNVSGQWVLDRTRSRIRRGSLSAATVNAAP
jgi:hypothetical protein